MSGGLTINADDLGRSKAETDAAIACHARGRVGYASAMVFMQDSERGAERARTARLPTGLHLNLSEAFSAGGVATALKQRHDRICRFLRSSRYALVLYNPWLTRDFDYVVKSQLDEYARLFGDVPARLDGHQHMHLATNVLRQKLIPAGTRVRRSFSFDTGSKSALNLWYRRRVDAAIARRHPLSDRFYSLSAFMDLPRLTALSGLAATLDVELMTHPVREREYDLLTSDGFGRILESLRAPAAGDVTTLACTPEGVAA